MSSELKAVDKSDTNYLIMEILSCLLFPAQTSEVWSDVEYKVSFLQT